MRRPSFGTAPPVRTDPHSGDVSWHVDLLSVGAIAAANRSLLRDCSSGFEHTRTGLE